MPLPTDHIDAVPIVTGFHGTSVLDHSHVQIAVRDTGLIDKVWLTGDGQKFLEETEKFCPLILDSIVENEA